MRIAVAVLLFVGAVAFGFGINWGLPSRDVDAFLISAVKKQSSGSSLSGAGIDHLAGGWEDDPNRAADVAMHPIADRTRPVTLLENPITADEILKTGDLKLAPLVKQQETQYQRWQALAAQTSANKAQVNREQALFYKDKARIDDYVEQYNRAHLIGYKDLPVNDPVNRARILRRYRLYSNQPDEMITLRSLGQMHPGAMDFDPRMYQYGGLWIYPVAAIIKAAGLINIATVTPDRASYLDHPERFATLYILMRGYSAFWGLIGIVTVMFLMRRATGGVVLPVIAGLCFIFLPVVISLAHEAKPHLAGITLTLLAVGAAANYIHTGKFKWVVWTGIACGAAVAMVISAWVALVLIPVMALLRKDRPSRFARTCALAGIFAAVIYFAANPYVAIHLARAGQRQVLRSNFGNTAAMYQRGGVGKSIVNATRLIAVGTSAPLALIAIAGCVGLLIRKSKSAAIAQNADPSDPVEPTNQSAVIARLLGAVAIVSLIQFVIFAAGKPPEYARFGALVDVALMMAAVASISRLVHRPSSRAIAGAVMLIAMAPYTAGYIAAFARGAGNESSRIVAARKIESILHAFPPGRRLCLGVYQEPAPYCLPPVDLYRWKIVLLNKDYSPSTNGTHVDMIVEPDDALNVWIPGRAPISWAATSFRIQTSAE